MSEVTAALYLRISSDRTGDELGVTRQREDCLQLAERRGWQVGEIYQDNDITASGKKERPQFEAMMQNLGRFSVVIAWSFERLTRNRQDTVRLIEGCQERSLTIALARGSDLDMSTPMGRVMADTMAAYARLEIEQESDRRIRANAQAAAMGKAYGTGRAFGYLPGNKELDPAESTVLREMADRVIHGQTYAEIAAWANAEGYTTAQGNIWRSITVHNRLLNKHYAAIRDYKGVEYAGTWQPVFAKPTWERLQLAMRQRAIPSPAPRPRSYLLTGLLECGRCEHPMIGSRLTDGKSKPYRSYICPRQGDGCGLTKSAIPLDHLITESVLYRLDSTELGQLLQPAGDNSQLRQLIDERSALQNRLDNFADDYALGILTKQQMARATQTAQAELSHLEDAIARTQHSHIPLLAGQRLSDAWQSETLSWRRSLLSLLIKKVVASPSKRLPYYVIDGRRYRFDPDSVLISWLA